MTDPAVALFESLNTLSDLNALIDGGEAEGQLLECKAPSSPQLGRDLKDQLARAISGFANTAGGVILWGIATVRHAASGLDVITSIQPIGSVRRFAQLVDRALPALAYPALQFQSCKVIHSSKGATSGVVATLIPKSNGDPVQSLFDRRFYMRTGDEFIELPYELLRRMFSGTRSPDLTPLFDGRIVSLEQDGSWRIPIILQNDSSAPAGKTVLSVEVLNSSACESVIGDELDDVSSINPGQKIFMRNMEGPIFRSLNMVAGALRVQMKKGKRPRRVMRLKITVYSEGMRARSWEMNVQLAKKGFSVKKTQDKFLY